jgi:hypothetical protein
VNDSPQVSEALYEEHKKAVLEAQRMRTEVLNTAKGLLGELRSLLE